MAMKISELIQSLQKFQHEHGDVLVTYVDTDTNWYNAVEEMFVNEIDGHKTVSLRGDSFQPFDNTTDT